MPASTESPCKLASEVADVGCSLGESWDSAFWDLVMRPPRLHYDPVQLGPLEFYIQDKVGCRQDTTLRAPSGPNIQCSHFIPRHVPKDGRPVVIYLHGLAGSRMEVAPLLELLLPKGVSVFCYDSIASGLSEGRYSSLGWHERDVLAVAIKHLRAGGCGKIGIWGRSMGAATALMHGPRDPAIAAMVLDSPFSSLPGLLEELAAPLHLPSWISQPILSTFRRRVRSLAHFDINDVVPLDYAPFCEAPVLFLHAREDTFVRSSHSEALFAAYAGRKGFIAAGGTHSSRRSAEDLELCGDFLLRELLRTDSSPLARQDAVESAEDWPVIDWDAVYSDRAIATELTELPEPARPVLCSAKSFILPCMWDDEPPRPPPASSEEKMPSVSVSEHCAVWGGA